MLNHVIVGIFFFMEQFLHWRHCHEEECSVHTFPCLNLIGDGTHSSIDGTLIVTNFLLNYRRCFPVIVSLMLRVKYDIRHFSILNTLKVSKMEKNKSFIIDLSKIKGSGEFNCPKCGTTISPDDQSEEVYTILEPIVKKDHLEKVVLQCKMCGSKISLIGFHALGKLD